ncbi:MAG: hypothetical protein V1753_06510 [Pseudomonadota bacterium]
MTSGRNGHPYTAKCPRCEAKFKAWLDVEYTGRDVLRRYCEDCKVRIGYYTNKTCPRLEYDIIEGRF